MSHHRETVNAEGAPAAVGPYVHAVRAGGLIFCSGQIALDPATGELVGDSVEEQTESALENLKIVCAAAGASLADAVRMTVYLTDIENFARVNEVYARAFEGGEPPARTAYAVAALPKGADVEIDAIVASP